MDWPRFETDRLLHEIIECRMGGRRRIQMLHDLANDSGYMLHSNGQLRTERGGDTKKRCQKPAVAEDY